MRIKHKHIFNFVFCACIFGLFTLAKRTELKYASIYTDSHNEEWKIPGNDTINYAAEWFIDIVPRWNYKFSYLSPNFDMSDENYQQSNMIYLFFGLFLVILFILLFSIVLIMKYVCNCCGGKLIPRGGYSTFQIDGTRGSILFFSFILEFMLIYGYFLTTDMDNAMGTLNDRFEEYSSELPNKVKTLISGLPQELATFYDKEIFEKDLQYSLRAAQMGNQESLSLFKTYESIRMVLIIVGLVAATVACSVGIAAGAVHRSWPIIVMVVLSMVGGSVLLFSFTYHFAFAKSMREFCTDSGTYIDSRNQQFLPQRLQFFIPCISSPLYSFLSDHYYINALLETTQFSKELDYLKESNAEINFYTPTFNNVSAKSYSDIVTTTNNNTLKKVYDDAVNISTIALIIDESRTCRWTKDRLKDEQFLMCSFTMDAVERLILTQAVAGVIMFIITGFAIRAIKIFKYAETLHKNNSNRDGQSGFVGRPARNKRLPE